MDKDKAQEKILPEVKPSQPTEAKVEAPTTPPVVVIVDEVKQR